MGKYVTFFTEESNVSHRPLFYTLPNLSIHGEKIVRCGGENGAL